MLAYGMPFLLLPIGFYAWCAWLVVRLPSKILAQDCKVDRAWRVLTSCPPYASVRKTFMSISQVLLCPMPKGNY
eukprot:2777803-Amphidinium_carterae.1